jgi:hypothetical protein
MKQKHDTETFFLEQVVAFVAITSTPGWMGPGDHAIVTIPSMLEQGQCPVTRGMEDSSLVQPQTTRPKHVRDIRN